MLAEEVDECPHLFRPAAAGQVKGVDGFLLMCQTGLPAAQQVDQAASPHILTHQPTWHEDDPHAVHCSFA